MKESITEYTVAPSMRLRRQPYKQIFFTLLERLQILLPRTWFGLFSMQVKKGSLPLEAMDHFLHSLLGLFLPLLVLGLLQQATNTLLAQNDRHLRLTGPYLLSPWAWACITQLENPLQQLLVAGHAAAVSRAYTLDRAHEAFQERLQQGRVYRYRLYDLYVPTPSRDHTNGPQEAAILVPGLYVSHTAYSEIASRLSDEGILVVVVSQEPLRMTVLPHVGATVPKLRHIVQSVQRQWLAATQTTQPSVLRWTWIGHSLGAFVVMELLKDENRVKFEIQDAVFWGLNPYSNFATNLTDYSSGRLLMVTGSCDVGFRLFPPPAMDNFVKMYLPPTLETAMIQGGSHCGFASYQARDAAFQAMDEATIPLSEQHEQVCSATTRFIKQKAQE